MKLTNPELIVKRSYKEVYKDGDKIVKIFEKTADYIFSRLYKDIICIF